MHIQNMLPGKKRKKISYTLKVYINHYSKGIFGIITTFILGRGRGNYFYFFTFFFLKQNNKLSYPPILILTSILNKTVLVKTISFCFLQQST